ncbi:hypothetical protein Taro_049623 [Colocasia esculenta]|uniref:Secreted protein n=1 Tax=Colocasia esculenta TaxID=4460 RepID=A0A843XBI5_COLES|nr:hypothetical protein [Colocasia esculenta]
MFHAISEIGFLVALACTVLSGCLVQAPNCCFGNPFLGAVRGGTGGMSEVQGGSACGPSTLWWCEVAVPVVRDVGAYVVRLWSHVVAPVFRELLCLGGCVPRCLLSHCV